MGRPFRRQSERRQIARPSYGGEREPDSHPTPGPPTLVQSARVLHPASAGRRRGAARGLSVLWGGQVASAGGVGGEAGMEDDTSAGDWIAAALRPLDEHVVGSLVPPLFPA